MNCAGASKNLEDITVMNSNVVQTVKNKFETLSTVSNFSSTKLLTS